MLSWSQSTASQLYSSTWRTNRPFQNYAALGNGCVSQPVRKPLSWKEGKKENHYGKWNKRQRSDQKPLSISSFTTHSSEKTALRRYFTVTIHCTLSMIMHRLCHTDWGMCWMQPQHDQTDSEMLGGLCMCTIPTTRKKHAIKSQHWIKDRITGIYKKQITNL